jgi:chemotaxis protein histidine kinase CheA
MIADALDHLGIALSIAVAIGLLVVIIARLIGEPIQWWWAIVPPVAVAMAIALGLTWRRRLTDLEAATDVDTTLNLRDRLGSSLELESLDRTDPFVQLLERDADEAASKADITAATPIRFGNSWITWPSLVGLLVLAVMFMPTLDLLGRQKAAQQRAQQESQVEEASDTLEELIEQTKQELANLEPTLEEDEGLQDILEELKSQVEEGELSPEEAIAQAEAAMDEKSEALEEEAALAEQQAEMVKEMLAEAADPNNMDPSDLEKALESGDFDAASEALSELQQSLSAMSEEDRQAMSESMSEMAERLNEAAQNKQAQNNATQRMAEELQQKGMSKELAEQLANSADAEQIAQQLQQQGMSAEDAEKLAQKISQSKSESDCRNGASRSASKLAEALKQAGKDAGEGNPGEMGELAGELGGLSDAELEGQLAALAAQSMSQGQGQGQGDGGGVGGNEAGEGSEFNEQLPFDLGKSFTKDVENRKGGGEGEVAMRYTRDRPVEWDGDASQAPMRAARIKEAAEAAEQAIEEQAFSPRYRGTIREYFERAQKIAPPAQTGDDREDEQNKGDQESK